MLIKGLKCDQLKCYDFDGALHNIDEILIL